MSSSRSASGTAAKAKKAPRTIEHLVPTPGTVRQLYGTAFACAKPGCGAPLYRVSDSNGRHVLNSHVAHIHARSEGGPRWDPAMAEADNRGPGNLLLLCQPHAWEIDQFPDEFPAEMLRDWKDRQLAEFERLRKGWPINDDDIAQAMASVDLPAAFAHINEIMPFNPRMRGRAEAWQNAVRRGHGRRLARVTPFVSPDRRPAVLSWMAALDDPVVEIAPGQTRVLIAPLGAGKSEQAARWWSEGLQEAANDTEIDIPLFLRARSVVSGLEKAIVAELGHDPTIPCRIVVDELDGVTAQEALLLLDEARELVQVWPAISVLFTARPGIATTDEEQLVVEPWPADRGAELVELALGDEPPWHRLWNDETADLLTSPLTALGLAARIAAGRDTRVSRSALYAGLAEQVLRGQRVDASDDTWLALAQLAVRIIERPGPAASSTFSVPELRRLTSTGLVTAEDDELTFALTVFEQYFGSQALRLGLVDIETIASAGSFPRWRYAIAFAVSTSVDRDQERLMTALARVNPAAASWTLDEVNDGPATTTGNPLAGPSEQEMAALIVRRDPDGDLIGEPDLPIRAGLWLRRSEQAFLSGLGPLAPMLARHRDGQLVQWGVWLHGGYLTLGRSQQQTPPPEVVGLPEQRVHLGLWHRGVISRFPTTDLGRWRYSRKELRQQLATVLRRQILPVPADSVLARERLYRLAAFVQDYGTSRRRRPIDVAQVRDTVAIWMQTVNRSRRASWGTGGKVDSDDVRWLSAHLETETLAVLPRPWPKGDRQSAGTYAFEAYSPELTLTVATDIVREALIGYRQLVETCFPAFGNALGLYSILPVSVEGLVERPDGTDNGSECHLLLRLHPDPSSRRSAAPTFELKVVNSSDHETLWEFSQRDQRDSPSAFGPSLLQDIALPLHHPSPVTELSYQWLVKDLEAVGWAGR